MLRGNCKQGGHRCLQIRIEGSIATGEGGAEDSRGISGSDVRTPPRRRNPDAAESSIPEEDEGDVEAP